jgi:hypothetical protein
VAHHDQQAAEAARILAGAVLVTTGLLVLAGRFIDGLWGDAWPVFILFPGVAVLALGLYRREWEGVAGCGGALTMLGLVLLYQNLTGHWESWAYVWALVAPTGVGGGLWLRAALGGDEPAAARAARVMVAGLGLFVVGVAFFEGIVHVSGRDPGLAGDLALPVLLVVAGVWMLAGRRRTG